MPNILEDWSTLTVGQDVNDSATWAAMAGGAGQALVSTAGFTTGVRAAAWEGAATYGGFVTKWTNQAIVWVDFYWAGGLNSGTGNSYIAKIAPSADGTPGAEFRVSSTGKFQIRDNTAAVATSTMNAVLDGRFYRFRWKVNQTGTTQFVDIFTGANLHGTVPDETISGAYTQGNIGQLILGTPANPNGTDVSFKYSYIGVHDSGFTAPYAAAAIQLDTPTGFVFNRVAGSRSIIASCTAVDGAVTYDLEVQYLSGSNPAVEGDWSPLATFNSATPSWTLTSANGLTWGETYRGRIVAKV